MKTAKLTSKEIRALDAYLQTNPCRSGCVYPEMEKSRKDCDECELTKSFHSIIEKLGLIES